MLNKLLLLVQIKLHSKKWLKKYALGLNRFRNIHQGEDCFIIGNGPSLNKMDLSLLNDYYTFGLNKIFLIFKNVDLKLSYHVAVNPLVVEQSKNEIPNLNCPSFLSFLPAVKNHIKSENGNIYYLGDLKPKKLFYKDITEGFEQGSTVTYSALQIAYFMGFKRVFLIGVDHNFFQTGNPNEQQKMNNNDPNHFDPNYFKGQKWHLADLEGSECHYTIAKYYFEKDGREIFDATIDGKLDIFKKIDFEEALKMAKKKK